MTAARVVIVLLLARAGWWFVQEKVLAGLPLVVVPGLVAVVLTGQDEHGDLPAATGTRPAGELHTLSKPRRSSDRSAPVPLRRPHLRSAERPVPLSWRRRAAGVAAALATVVVGHPLTPFAVLGLVLLVALLAAQQLSRGSVVQVTAALAVGAVLVALGGA